MTLELDSLHPETQVFPLPLGGGSCEKIRFADEISFSRCPGDGKIRAAKIGGTGMIRNGLPAFREGTQSIWPHPSPARGEGVSGWKLSNRVNLRPKFLIRYLGVSWKKRLRSGNAPFSKPESGIWKSFRTISFKSFPEPTSRFTCRIPSWI